MLTDVIAALERVRLFDELNWGEHIMAWVRSSRHAAIGVEIAILDENGTHNPLAPVLEGSVNAHSSSVTAP